MSREESSQLTRRTAFAVLAAALLLYIATIGIQTANADVARDVTTALMVFSAGLFAYDEVKSYVA